VRQLRRLTPAIRHIEENLANPQLRIDSISRILTLSPSRTRSLFREVLGVSPKVLIGQRRMGRAAMLLVTTDMSAKQVSVASGFADHQFFHRAFKKMHGTTPLAYRRRMRAALAGKREDPTA
jgi:AraC-like DNA-binding protein